jgi:hypothetical protein
LSTQRGDRLTDPLLQRAARGAEAGDPPTGACLDAETAAAWVDGGLAPLERTAATGHLADCARCRAVVAALIRTDPPAAVRPSWWALPIVRWAAPLATAAAALVVWVVVEREPARPAEPAASQVARSVSGEEAREQAPGPPAASAPVREGTQASKAEAAPPAGSRPASPAEPSAKATATEEKRAAADAVAPRRSENALAAQAAPAAQAETLTSQSDRASRFAALPVIAAPDGSTRWRIAVPGTIERSTDGGATWQRQPLETAAPLASGSSPASDVCWFVGAGGVVIRTTDGGRTWRTVSSPDPTDLVAITARDADVAEVTTADGRTFRTTDGGVTWRR